MTGRLRSHTPSQVADGSTYRIDVSSIAIPLDTTSIATASMTIVIHRILHIAIALAAMSVHSVPVEPLTMRHTCRGDVRAQEQHTLQDERDFGSRLESMQPHSTSETASRTPGGRTNVTASASGNICPVKSFVTIASDQVFHMYQPPALSALPALWLPAKTERQGPAMLRLVPG